MISLFKNYLHITVLFLATTIKRPDEYDWGKLKIILEYLKGTKHTKLRLRVEYFSVVNWWIYSSYNTRADFMGRTGSIMILGKGSVLILSLKQKLNLKSST